MMSTLVLEDYKCDVVSFRPVIRRNRAYTCLAVDNSFSRPKASMQASTYRHSLQHTSSAPCTLSTRDDSEVVRCGDYTIRQSRSQPASATLPRTVILSCTLTKLLISIFYLLARIRSWNPGVHRYSDVVLLVAEALILICNGILSLNLALPLLRSAQEPRRPIYRLIGPRAPTVDVCVTCCGEPTAVISNTVKAAAALDYPAHCLRIIVLDDGHDVELKTVINNLAIESAFGKGPLILYRSRSEASQRLSHYKSGNLQYGLDELAKLGASEFFANLDCDMIPAKGWLRSMLPHLLLDNKIALANPPQDYYNVLHNDSLGQRTDLDVFFSNYEPLNDKLGAARCMGTGFVMRRRAVDSIGGWPLINVGEDFMLSSALLNAGWRTCFVPEKVQQGLAPNSLHAYIKQKQRWVDGAIEVHKRFGFYTPWSQCAMTLRQRLVFVLQALREYTPLLVMMSLVALPISALSSMSAPKDRLRQSTRAPTSYIFLHYIIDKIAGHSSTRHIQRDRLHSLQSLEIWMAPYAAVRCLRSFFPCFFAKLSFSPSGSFASSASEQDARSQQSWARLLDRYTVTHLAFAVYLASPLLFVLARLIAGSYRHALSTGLVLLSSPHVLVILMTASYKAAVPALYLIWPPSNPDWKELTHEDENGVRRPYTVTAAAQISTEHEAHSRPSRMQAIEVAIFACAFVLG